MDIKNLSAWILEDLKKSGLDESIICEMNVQEISDVEHLKENLGFAYITPLNEKERKEIPDIIGNNPSQSILQMSACYVIPYPDGFKRVKLQYPIAGIKYLSPLKTFCPETRHVYYLPLEKKKMANVKYSMIFTEGEKKTSKLTQECRKLDHFTAAGFPGVNMWNSEELKEIRVSGRNVYLAFDSDFRTNADVEHQLLQLWLFLRKNKAAVRALVWDEKLGKGIDDYLVNQEKQGHNPTESLQKLIDGSVGNIFGILQHTTYQILASACAKTFQSIDEDCKSLWEEFKLSQKYGITWTTFKKFLKKEYAKKLKQDKKENENTSEEKPCYIDDNGKVIPGIASRYFFDNQAGNLIYNAENFWRYDKTGVWKQIEDKQIKEEIKKMLGDKLGKRAIVEDIAYLTMLSAYTPEKDLWNKSKNLLNFPNGILDITTGQVLPHKKEYYLTIQFPFDCPFDEIGKDYNEYKKAKCHSWLKFLKDLGFKNETYLRLQEWGGYCLVAETRIEKCLFLKGDGGNGKSVFLETLASMLGQNASHLEMSELFDKFKIAEIQGKLVNFATDIETTKVLDSRFKKLVSGEKQSAEKKHKDPFEFRPCCKFLFSANDFIPTKDRSYGFFRRFDILEFTKIFTEHERDETLKDKLKAELPGIFLWCYEGLRRLMANKWKLTRSEEMDKALEEFQQAANPLKQFVEKECMVHPDASISTTAFREKYIQWCKDNGYEALAENKLGRELKRLGHERERKREYERLIYVYKGITIT